MRAALPGLPKVLFRREARLNNTLDLTVQPLLYTYPDGAAPPPRCISPRFGRAGQRGVGIMKKLTKTDLFLLALGATIITAMVVTGYRGTFLGEATKTIMQMQKDGCTSLHCETMDGGLDYSVYYCYKAPVEQVDKMILRLNLQKREFGPASGFPEYPDWWRPTGVSYGAPTEGGFITTIWWEENENLLWIENVKL